jgi:hypothetical protein
MNNRDISEMLDRENKLKDSILPTVVPEGYMRDGSRVLFPYLATKQRNVPAAGTKEI